MPRGRGPKKVDQAKRRRVQRSVRSKKSPSKRTTTTFDDSGRESGIRAASTTTRADKKKSLEQSIGSLDRRINNAVDANNLDLAKDLRSRQNKFVKNLGFFNATNTPGGVARTGGPNGRIIRTSDGSPVLTNAGLAAFNQTVDRDFLDPTRKLINENPQAYAAMYPITNQLRQGLPGTRVAKEFLGMDDKQQKYTDAQMPGQRYALDKDFGAGTGPEIMDDEIIADDFDKSLDVAPDAVPLPDVTIRQKPEPDDPGFTAFNEFLLGIGDNLKNPDMVDARVRGPEDFTAMTGENVRFPGSNQFDFSQINNLFKGLGSNLKTTDGARAQGPTERTGFLDMGANLRNQTTSGEDFANQVANNATVMKENISNAPNLNADQKQVLMNEVDRQMTQFQPSSGLDMLTSDAPISLPQVVDQQLNTSNVSRVRGPNDASEAAALEVLNSLDNQNRGFSLSDLFDANPDQQGFQLFNLNPNR